MAPSATHNDNEPLLNGSHKAGSEIPVAPLSSTTQTAIKALSVIRVATGVACVFAPIFTCGLFKYTVPVENSLLVRMFGVRDFVMGELLITAEDKKSPDGDRREIRRAIWTGIAVDTVDIGSVAYAVAMGHVGKTTGGLLGAAALGAIGLAAVGLRGL
ncbi:hypothetical protein IQ07DRAFT_640976 [Pyrenochaeta sp. DS3sAY3a]|nr:hypothetical protein IQ07DRAFT_640976 [Pyrenochaeta sp. DS3sAY3a]